MATHDLSYEFENMPVKLVATKKIPGIETAGLSIGETDVNKELTVNLWIARELIEAGLARFADGGIGGEEWTQIHYRERLLPIGQLSPLPSGFYSRAYLTFHRLEREAKNDATRMQNVNRLRGMFRDILESRINKIVRLASAEASTASRDLQPEEAFLFREVQGIVSAWRGEIKRLGVR